MIPEWLQTPLSIAGTFLPILALLGTFIGLYINAKKNGSDTEETRAARIQGIADGILAQKIQENTELLDRLAATEAQVKALTRYLRTVLTAHMAAGLTPPPINTEDAKILDLDITIPEKE
jgi:hypothetical protein